MIHFDDQSTGDFIKSWNDSNPWIEANTSGSTGQPKTIRLSKADMEASARATCQFFSIDRSSLMVCPLSANYIAGKMMIVRSMVSGAELYMEHPSNHPLSDGRWRARTIDLVPIVPSQIDGIVRNINNSGISVRNIIVGGAPMSVRETDVLSRISGDCYATYGMTETCSHVALKNIGHGESIFRALPGYSFSTDGRGCLIIDSDTQSFKRIITNDIVKLHDETGFEWIGRHDNVIISGGLKIHPEQVERHIARLLPDNRPFYITSAPDEKWGQRAVLCIEGEPFETDTMLRELRYSLKLHELPREIKFIAHFERTQSGKIKRIGY